MIRFWLGALAGAAVVLLMCAAHARASVRPPGCWDIQTIAAAMLSLYEDAAAHRMTEDQRRRFARETQFFDDLDDAMWLERPGVEIAYVAIFRDGCRIASGEVRLDLLKGWMNGEPA